MKRLYRLQQPFIAKAPMVLVFCADYKRWIEVFEKYDTDVRKPEEGDMLLAQADAKAMEEMLNLRQGD